MGKKDYYTYKEFCAVVIENGLSCENYEVFRETDQRLPPSPVRTYPDDFYDFSTITGLDVDKIPRKWARNKKLYEEYVKSGMRLPVVEWLQWRKLQPPPPPPRYYETTDPYQCRKCGRNPDSDTRVQQFHVRAIGEQIDYAICNCCWDKGHRMPA